MNTPRWWWLAGVATRVAAGVVVAANVAKGARRVSPIEAADRGRPTGSIAVVVPARDEAQRIGPLLERVLGAAGVDEVLVVDDESSDGTARIARAAGATVVVGGPLPDGWAGKAWALQQGLEAAAAEWIVFLDADTRPDPVLPRALVARAIADGIDLLSVAGRFECPSDALAWVHPAMLTTLVYRYGPPGADRPNPPGRVLANGQCMAVRRERLLAAGGLRPVGGHIVEDVALARHLAARGWRVEFLDAAGLLTVRMYETFGEAWRGWGRSLALTAVERRGRQLTDLAVVFGAQVLPLARLALRRADLVDAALLVVRAGTLAGTARAYTHRGAAYWLSPTADAVAVAAVARGIAARRQHWRGRWYPVGARGESEADADEGQQRAGPRRARRRIDGELDQRVRDER